MYPKYSYPRDVIAGLVRDAILSRHRVFRDDARASVSRLDPPLRIFGEENIPQDGPCVITVNHYFRPGFAAQWLAIAISSVVSKDIHWIITGELTFPGNWYAPIGMPISRFILNRGARVYGFTTMPPMPPRPRDVEARAKSVRAVLDYVMRAENPIIGLAPEGGDQPGGVLTMPASGVGRFALLLAAQRLKFAPVGIYEEAGRLCLNFGETYSLSIPNHLSANEKDKQAARIMMEHIAGLLPSNLRGEFGS
ncbi:MAG: 1-acyl-sn-glycerol-3-phosphate acyltransferase [Chloroflexi bacterium]|nr:1-acyl-sn-glycerol-3-phosphate acyltransferase [Chloroflexota bacterium]